MYKPKTKYKSDIKWIDNTLVKDKMDFIILSTLFILLIKYIHNKFYKIKQINPQQETRKKDFLIIYQEDISERNISYIKIEDKIPGACKLLWKWWTKNKDYQNGETLYLSFRFHEFFVKYYKEYKWSDVFTITEL